MEFKCDYCGGNFDDRLEKCPHCGAVNNNIKRTAGGTPKTIEELAQWYKDHNLPPYEKTRFFIGVDYKKPRAFGIYKDGSEYVVYKNKDNGERAFRYRGNDEGYAVNELYLKLKSEILNQKARNTSSHHSSSYGKNDVMAGLGCFGTTMGIIGLFIAGITSITMIAIYPPVLFLLAIPIAIYLWVRKRKPEWKPWSTRIFIGVLVLDFLLCIGLVGDYSTPKYYNYNDIVYVQYNDDYYRYDPFVSDYYYVSDYEVPSDISNYGVEGDSLYSWDSGFTDFESSDYYDENLDSGSDSYSSSDSWSSSSWDSDYSWDSSDSWDSGSSDWGSDW